MTVEADSKEIRRRILDLAERTKSDSVRLRAYQTLLDNGVGGDEEDEARWQAIRDALPTP